MKNGNVIDLSGRNYGDFRVMSYAGRTRWLLRCKCGAEVEISGKHIRDGKARKRCNHNIEQPTRREAQVGDLLAAGFTARQIASTLDISFATTRKHIESLYSKLNVNKRLQFLAVWLKKP